MSNNVVQVDFSKKVPANDPILDSFQRLVDLAEDIELNPEKYLKQSTLKIIELQDKIEEIKAACFPPLSVMYQPEDTLASTMETIVVFKSDYARWRATEELILKL
jgi:hypothetical protein